MEAIIPAAIIGVFSVVILYFASLFLILGPSLGFSNREICQIRSHLRRLIYCNYEGQFLTLKEIDYLSAIERVEMSILNFDIKRVSVIAKAVSGEPLDSLSLEIKSLRRRKLDAVKRNITSVFESEDSAEKLYKKLRRVFFKYRLNSRMAGVWFFSRRVMPGAVDRWGRYVTITAISAVIIGYSIWFLNGENGIDATDNLISKSVNYLSVGALISVISVALVELFLGIFSVYHQKVLGIKESASLLLVAVASLATMVWMSVSLKFNYLYLAVLLFSAINVPSEPAAWCLFLGFPLGLYYALKWCHKTWRLKGRRRSSRLFSTATVFYLIFVSISICMNFSQLSDEILSFTVLIVLLACAIFIFSGVLKFIEILVDVRNGVFILGKSGVIFCVSTALLLILAVFILIGFQKMGELEYYSVQFDSISGDAEEYYAFLNKAMILVLGIFIAFTLATLLCVTSLFSFIRLAGRHSESWKHFMDKKLEFSTAHLGAKNMKNLIKNSRRERFVEIELYS